MEAFVSLDAKNQSNQPKRSKTAILVKNLPYDTQEDNLMKLFTGGGRGGLVEMHRNGFCYQYHEPLSWLNTGTQLTPNNPSRN